MEFLKPWKSWTKTRKFDGRSNQPTNQSTFGGRWSKISTPMKTSKYRPWKLMVGRRSFPIGARKLFRAYVKLPAWVRWFISFFKMGPFSRGELNFWGFLRKKVVKFQPFFWHKLVRNSGVSQLFFTPTLTGWWLQIYFHPYLGKIPVVTNIYFKGVGFHHELVEFFGVSLETSHFFFRQSVAIKRTWGLE